MAKQGEENKFKAAKIIEKRRRTGDDGIMEDGIANYSEELAEEKIRELLEGKKEEEVNLDDFIKYKKWL